MAANIQIMSAAHSQLTRPALSSRSDSNSKSSESTEQSEKLRILLADDSRIIRVAVKRILTDKFDLIEAVDGEKAWNLLNADDTIDVLLTDLYMPELDGYGLIERLRGPENPLRLRNLPIMVLSGTDDMAERERAFKCGATDYVTKPFDSNQITARVEALARQARQQREELQSAGAKEDPGTVDPLTGLSNLAYFEHHGAKNLSFTQRHSKDLSLILIHVDDIVGLTEKHGAPVVDQLLRKLGEFVSGAVRTLETVARIAPHKFGIIAPMTNDIGVLELANRIAKKVRKTVFRNASGEIRFTVSMGLASPRVHLLRSFSQLVDIAERRLSAALESGGNCIIHEDAAAKPGEQLNVKARPIKREEPKKPAKPTQQKTYAALPDSDASPPIETALWLLKNGQADKLKPHYKSILLNLLPLLAHADECWELELKECLEGLQKRLDAK